MALVPSTQVLGLENTFSLRRAICGFIAWARRTRLPTGVAVLGRKGQLAHTHEVSDPVNYHSWARRWVEGNDEARRRRRVGL